MSRKKYDYLFLVFFAVTILFAFILGSHMDTIVNDRTNSNDVKKTSMVFEGEQFEFYYEFDLPDEDVEGKNIKDEDYPLLYEVYLIYKIDNKILLEYLQTTDKLFTSTSEPSVLGEVSSQTLSKYEENVINGSKN